MRKFLALLLTLSLMISTVVPAFANEPYQVPITDYSYEDELVTDNTIVEEFEALIANINNVTIAPLDDNLETGFFSDAEVWNLINMEEVNRNVLILSEIVGPRSASSVGERVGADFMTQMFLEYGLTDAMTYTTTSNATFTGPFTAAHINNQPYLVVHDFLDQRWAEFGITTPVDRSLPVSRNHTTGLVRTSEVLNTGGVFNATPNLVCDHSGSILNVPFPGQVPAIDVDCYICHDTGFVPVNSISGYVHNAGSILGGLDLAGAAGRIVVIDTGLTVATVPTASTNPTLLQVQSAYHVAVAAGASAVLFSFNERATPFEGSGLHSVRPSGLGPNDVHPFPGRWVPADRLDRFSSWGAQGGGSGGTSPSQGAMSWANFQIQETTVPHASIPGFSADDLLKNPNTRATFTLTNNNRAYHSIARILPSDGRLDAPIIAFVAHLDTHATTAGAADNGSGMAVVLELARVFQILADRGLLEYELIFSAVGAEEGAGMIGAHAIARGYAPSFNNNFVPGVRDEARRNRIIAAYNFDIVAPGDPWNAGMTLSMRQAYHGTALQFESDYFPAFTPVAGGGNRAHYTIEGIVRPSNTQLPIMDLVARNSLAAAERLTAAQRRCARDENYLYLPVQDKLVRNMSAQTANPHFSIQLTNGGGSDHVQFGIWGIPNANHSFRGDVWRTGSTPFGPRHPNDSTANLGAATVPLETIYHTIDDRFWYNYCDLRMEIVLKVAGASAWSIARTGPMVIVPELMQGVSENLNVVVFDGIIPWTTTSFNLANPTWNPPGNIERIAFNDVLGGFPVSDSGWFTVFAHGPLDTIDGHSVFGGAYYTVTTFFRVTPEELESGGNFYLPIETSRRPARIPGTLEASIWGNPAFFGGTGAAAAPANNPLRRGGIHGYDSLPHTWSVNQSANLNNHLHQVRVPSIHDRFEVDGNWTIAAVAPLADQMAGNVVRTDENRFALGSRVAPWSGPNHFQTPQFRNLTFDDRGWLDVSNSNLDNRSLYQWTTQAEMLQFLQELNASSPHMHLFDAGYAPHSFDHISNPQHFRMPFVMFTATDISAYAAVNDFAGAGAAIQNNGRVRLYADANIHGNEQSSRESILALIHSLATTQWGSDVVQDMNIMLIPDVNPTGAYRHFRQAMRVPGYWNQVHFDMNRDHMALHTREIYQIRQPWMAFMPHVTSVGHEITTSNASTGANPTFAVGASSDIEISHGGSLNAHPGSQEIVARLLRQQFIDSADSGIRTSNFALTGGGNPTIGRNFYSNMGAASIILETRNQAAGMQARRTYTQYMAIRSNIEYLRTHGVEIYSAISDVREDIITMGRYYDPANRIFLAHSSAPAAAQNWDPHLPGPNDFDRYVLYLTGGVQSVQPLNGISRFLPVAGRDISRPTGYVMLLGGWDTHPVGGSWARPADVAHLPTYVQYDRVVAQLMHVLHGQQIEYYVLPEGTVMPLQQYFVASAGQPNAHNAAFRQGVRPQEYKTIPAGGAIFIPMDQVSGTVIAMLMEPENSNINFGSSIVQMLLHHADNTLFDATRTFIHCQDTMNFPIFRLTQDNPRSFVYGDDEIDFGLNIFNNGYGGSPSTPNASLAAGGTIRMWTQIDGVNALVPYADLEVTAELPDGTDAMEFVTVNRIWDNPDNVNMINVTKNAPWARMTLTASLNGNEVEVELVNSRYLGLVAFNNGTDDEVPSMAGTIRIWPQLAGESAPIPMNAEITAVDQDDNDAMEFVTVNRLWTDNGWADYNANFDVSKDEPWETILFTVTVYGQTVYVLLINDWFEDDVDDGPVFGFDIFNNGYGGSPSRPNDGLAASGTIRMWTQIDGVNTLVPYADLTVTAVFPDDTNAMEFVRVNNMWSNPGNVNQINVHKDGGAWEKIILTATFDGQEVELLLVNSMYVPLTNNLYLPPPALPPIDDEDLLDIDDEDTPYIDDEDVPYVDDEDVPSTDDEDEPYVDNGDEPSTDDTYEPLVDDDNGDDDTYLS